MIHGPEVAEVTASVSSVLRWISRGRRGAVHTNVEAPIPMGTLFSGRVAWTRQATMTMAERMPVTLRTGTAVSCDSGFIPIPVTQAGISTGSFSGVILCVDLGSA
jgi:hypothetical protein